MAVEPAAEVEPESVALESPAEAEPVEIEAELEHIAMEGTRSKPNREVAAQLPAEPEARCSGARGCVWHRMSPLPASVLVPRPVGGVQGELAALFLEDAREILDHFDDGLRRWQLAPQERAPLDAIQRRLHTLKGSARLSGLAAIGDLSHALETDSDRHYAGRSWPLPTIRSIIAQRSLDALSDQVDAVEQGAPVPVASELIAALAAPLEAGPGPAGQARREATRGACAGSGRARGRNCLPRPVLRRRRHRRHPQHRSGCAQIC